MLIWWSRLNDFLREDTARALTVFAASIALATAPIAFAILGRLNYFETRRGRTFQKPTFSSVVCALLLCMTIPAILLGVMIKSRYYDKDRYEFDPNRTITVLDQGRGLRSLEAADEALRAEQKRLAETRKNLVNGVKKLDDAMLNLRASLKQAPSQEAAEAIPDVLRSLALIREAVGVDAPQQLMDETAPPVVLANVSGPSPGVSPVASGGSTAGPSAPAASPVPAKPKVAPEVAKVPEAQRPLALMLPLDGIPSGWAAGASTEAKLETFDAENLYEKIDGRAASFQQFGVKGMAYTAYHPRGDEASDVQLYVYEMGDALKARGKYDSEKGDDFKPADFGQGGYVSAGSVFFHRGPYYTQIIVAKEDPKLSAFALELAKRVDQAQKALLGDSAAPTQSGPEAVFALLPKPDRQGEPIYVAQDAFGYGFLSDVFMADYDREGVQWQGFLRPCATPDDANKLLDQYIESVKRDGAKIEELRAEGADRMIVAENSGLIDFLFVKGNVLAGANGATKPEKAEAFAKEFAKALPREVKPIGK